MDTNSKSSNSSAVILVSHGSTLPYAEEVFEEIKEKFINKSGISAEIGYMKVSEPTIAGAVEILKGEVEDLDKIIARPVFLAPGIHTNIDIPQLLGLEALEVDGTKLIIDGDRIDPQLMNCLCSSEQDQLTFYF